MYIPFSQFKFAIPRTSSWQHTGVEMPPQTLARATSLPTEGECALMAAAEVRLRRAEMVASVNFIVIVEVVEVRCLKGVEMEME